MEQRRGGGEAEPDTASHLTLKGRYDLPPLRFGLGEEVLSLHFNASPLYLPLVNRDGETWTLADASSWNGKTTNTTSLRLRRSGSLVTHDVLIDFGQPVALVASSPSSMGADLKVRSVTVTPAKKGELTITLRRVAR